ncbi:MAG: tetratricopeptide repeat protein [Phycisphaerae bacterium]|nr:tetratricopeptide repeat protein [Phycisphaerae bacterium]
MCADEPEVANKQRTPETPSNPAYPAMETPWFTVVVGITLLVLAVYWSVLNQGGFVIGDDDILIKNPRLTAEDGLSRIWFSTESEQYQPLLYTSYWLERRIWGLRPFGYHLVNVLLHAANTVLIWCLLRRIGVRGAAVAAAIFAVHPVNVESVAWIYERKNVLSGLFYFLTFLALFRFEERRGWLWYWLALLSFIAALLTKTSVVVLPAMLLLHWWWKRDLWRVRNLVASIPFFVLAGVMSAVTIWYEQHHTGASGIEYAAGFAERFARAGWIVVFYLGKAFVPHNLMFFYPRWSVDPSAVLSYLPHVVMFIVFVVLLAKRRRWGRPVLFGLGWYVIALFPVLGFFDIYYHRFSFVADHFQYLALVGLIALCTHVVSWGLERWGVAGANLVTGRARIGGQVVAGLAVLACIMLTYQRAFVFRSTATLLYADTLQHKPDSWLAHHKLAEYLRQLSGGEREKQLELARHHYAEALKLEPERGIILDGLGTTLSLLLKLELHQHPGEKLANRPDLLPQYQEALGYLRRAVAADPDSALFHINLGTMLEFQSGPEEVIYQYQEAVSCNPNLPVAQFRLGQALLRAGRVKDGIRRLRKAVELHPNHSIYRRALGATLCKEELLGEGLEHLREAVRLNPHDSQAAKLLAQMEHRRPTPSSAPSDRGL